MMISTGTWFVLLSWTGSAAASAAGSGDPREGPRSAPVQAAEAGGFTVRQGFYLDVHGTWAQLGGDFDGDTLLQGGTDTIEVPDADSGLGLGLAFGHRWARNALELSYTRTEHDGSLAFSSGGDVSYNAVDLDWRYFFRVQERLQPFFQAGLGFAFATLEDASMGGSGTGDGDLSGATFNLGGGAEYFLGERWSLGMRALYRFTSFDTAEGVDGDEGSIDESVDANGFALVLGATFTL